MVSVRVGILICVGLGLLGFAAWLRWGYSVPLSCQAGCARAPPYMNGPGCLSIVETAPSNSLPAPSPVPYAGNIYYAVGGPGSWCTPSYYAFRYVNNDDGTYSPLSAWSAAISAGGKAVYPPGTHGWKNDGCQSNSVQVVAWGVLDQLPPNTNGYTLNVHRQDEVLEPQAEGTIVGSMIVDAPGTPYPVQAYFLDAAPPGGGSPNPCC